VRRRTSLQQTFHNETTTRDLILRCEEQFCTRKLDVVRSGINVHDVINKAISEEIYADCTRYGERTGVIPNEWIRQYTPLSGAYCKYLLKNLKFKELIGLRRTTGKFEYYWDSTA
jgi:hypothetical protein